MVSDYEVGYGKPPRATQFARGQSGNPNGRPKGSKNVATIFHDVTRELIRVTENGKAREVTKVEAILRQLTAKAMSGDLKAMTEVLKLDRAFALVAEEATPEGPDAEKDQMIMQRLLSRMQAIKNEHSEKESPDDDTTL